MEERVAVEGVGAGQDVEHEAGVGDGAGHRAVGDEGLPALGGRFARDGAEGGLEAYVAADGGGVADRATAVAAVGQRARPGGDGDRGSAR
jgi:hypothetical protein